MKLSEELQKAHDESLQDFEPREVERDLIAEVKELERKAAIYDELKNLEAIAISNLKTIAQKWVDAECAANESACWIETKLDREAKKAKDNFNQYADRLYEVPY